KLPVRLSRPPASVKASGSDAVQMVQPYESMPVALDLADDVGVDTAAVEYRINDGASSFEPVPLQGRGTRKAGGQLAFPLSGKVKEGDTLQYRFKATDNRRVPEAGLEPNVAYHPPESVTGQPSWRVLKIARQAAPLQQQEIAAQHDEINKRIDALQRKLRDEHMAVQKLRSEVRTQETIQPPQAKEINNLRQQNREAASDLRELARD